ncbi:MAG: family 20 glycosylhydrolase [Clostridia bacterium]|nr:family 20 glycosylhydrolase [Clostridia bacterium]
MLFHPQTLIKIEGSFVFSGDISAIGHPCLNRTVIRDFWQGFSYQSSHLVLSECDTLTFSVGNAEPLSLEDCDYSIHVTERGISVCGRSEADLIRGVMTLLDRFVAIDCDGGLAIEIKGFQLRDKPTIQVRMVHFCIFPETELWELQRFVRFCGALKYTHVVLEFWGMLQYDCLRELSWSHGFSKEQIRPIIREANALGMEIIPMFNHWGHASAGRVIHGKHVVLDQNPSLQTYFSEDGWCWDIRKPKVRALLRQIREELIELCGDGKYFHIGCDEAYNFELTKENMDHVCDFLNEIAQEMRAVNRRAIVWGDMFLYRHPHYNPKNKYACNAPTPEVEQYMLSRLSRHLVLADWQYDPVEAPVETAEVFTKEGFDCLLCPWDRGSDQMNAVLGTVKEKHLMGFMHTTWHTLSKGMPYVALAAVGGFEVVEGWDRRTLRTCAAALLRKVMPIGGDYEKSGWSRIQIHSIWS